MNQIIEKVKDKVIVFDFDGALAIPYTQPEIPYPDVPYIINFLSKFSKLYMASFNPSAEEAITRWNLRDFFSDVRSGCNYTLSKDDIYSEEHRKDLSKSNQILSMGLRESFYFLDDDLDNIKNVKDYFGDKCKCLLIDNKIGLNFDYLLQLEN